MKAAVVGALTVLSVAVLAAVGARDAAAVATPAAGTASAGDLITLTSPLGEHKQQLTVIDPRTRVMGVYHVDNTSGEIALKSVRNFHWDLQMSEFNAAAPLPREIRSLLEQR
ncbi:MAG TPA: hypothetical protein VHV55_14850 [Pirellulales bacterium]|jgi:hypothetical protein|nr:hypothetical protein [Pirellulales bacterium]